MNDLRQAIHKPVRQRLHLFKFQQDDSEPANPEKQTPRPVKVEFLAAASDANILEQPPDP
jgi:hypothetical protein